MRGWIQGDNAQAACNGQHLIRAAEVMTASPDFGQLGPMVTATRTEPAAVGVETRPGVVVADVGYWHLEPPARDQTAPSARQPHAEAEAAARQGGRPRGPRRTQGMERVWDYPRPPVIAPCVGRVRVELADKVLAESDAALRVLETSHPPTIYLAPDAVRMDLLRPSVARATVCEFKGVARYLDAVVDGLLVRAVAWSYPDPTPAYEALRDHVAFYPGRVDAAWVGDELVTAQEGDFYGGWITSDLVGPFKGPAGTLAW